MSRHQLVVVFTTLLVVSIVCQAQVPITWPDPRRFTVKMEETEIVYSWDEVTSSSPDNEVYSLWVEQTEVASGKTETREEPSSQITMDIKSGRVKYSAIARIKTRFNPDGVYANISFISPYPRNQYYKKPSKRTVNMRAFGNGPFIVVVRDKMTGGCAIVIYNESSTSSIETTETCTKPNRLTRAIYVRFKYLPSNGVENYREFTYDLEESLMTSQLREIEVFPVEAPHKENFELDPPGDVYGIVKFKSPTVASVRFKYRPPMSFVYSIEKFNFIVSSSNVTITIPVTDLRGSSALTRKRVKEIQKTLEYLEFPEEIFLEYPGNYTVTAFTNGAVVKRAVFPVIMPNINPLKPTRMSVGVNKRDKVVDLEWEMKDYFGGTCAFEATATPADQGDKQSIHLTSTIPSANQIKNSVAFMDLSASVNYSFCLNVNCSNHPPFTTPAIFLMTPPPIPEPPGNLRAILINATSANLTWEAPPIPANTRIEYDVECWREYTRYNKQSYRVATTFFVFQNLMPEPLQCTVKSRAVNEGSGHTEESEEARSVTLDVPPVDSPIAPPVKMVQLNATAVEFDLMAEDRLDVVAFQVSVDDEVFFEFLLKSAHPTAGFNVSGESSVVVTRTNRTQFVLSNLVPHNTYKVTVVTHFYVKYIDTRTYEVKLTQPESNATSEEGSEAPRNTSSSTASQSTSLIGETRWFRISQIAPTKSPEQITTTSKAPVLVTTTTSPTTGKSTEKARNTIEATPTVTTTTDATKKTLPEEQVSNNPISKAPQTERTSKTGPAPTQDLSGQETHEGDGKMTTALAVVLSFMVLAFLAAVGVIVWLLIRRRNANMFTNEADEETYSFSSLQQRFKETFAREATN